MVPGSWTGNDGCLLYNKSGFHFLSNLVGQSISGDGTRVVGHYETGNNYFFWDGSPISVLGTIYGGSLIGMAAQGNFAVGTSEVYSNALQQYAILYYAGGDSCQYLNHPTGRIDSFDEAWACSADGTHVAGFSYSDDALGGQIPVEWLYGSPYNLPFISGTSRGDALAINDQGNLIFGEEGGPLGSLDKWSGTRSWGERRVLLGRRRDQHVQ
jgi:hypothetical protein